MNKVRQGVIWTGLVVVFIIIYICIWVYQVVNAGRTYRGVMNGERMDSITMLVESLPGSNKNISIVNDSILNKISRTFQYLQEFTPNSPKVHTVFSEMDI
jgi:hypothetical protein